MKIKLLEVFGYGKLHNITFHFNNNLQIIYGKNESGKTTLVSLIKGILFGYQDKRHSYNQYVPKNFDSYGGQILVTYNDHNYVICREKGSHGGKLTIINDQNQIVNNNILFNMLGPINRSAFNDLYYFGNVNIKNISNMTRESLIKKINKIGLTNSLQWMNLSKQLDKESKELYAPNGYKPLLNQKLKRYQKLSDIVYSFSKDSGKYSYLLKNKRKIKSENNDLRDSINDYSQKIYLLNKYYQYWDEHQDLKKLNNISGIINPHLYEHKDKEKIDKLNDKHKEIKNKINIINDEINTASINKRYSSKLKNYNKNKNNVDLLLMKLPNIKNVQQKINITKSNISNINHQINNFKSNNIINIDKSYPFNSEDSNKINDLNKNVVYLNHLNDSLIYDKNNYLNNIYNLNDKVSNQSITINYLIGTILVIVGLFTGKYWASIFGIIESIIVHILLEYHIKIKYLKNKKNINNKIQNIENKQNIYKQNINQYNDKLQSYKVKYNLLSDNVNDWFDSQNILKILNKLKINKRNYINNYINYNKEIGNYFKKWSKYLFINDNNENNIININKYAQDINNQLSNNDNIINQINNLLNQLNNDKKILNDVNNKINTFLKNRNINSISQFNNKYTQNIHILELKRKKKRMLEIFSFNQIKNLNKFNSISEIINKKDKYNLNLDKLRHDLNNNLDNQTKIDSKINEIIKNGTYDSLNQQLSNLKTEINSIIDEWLTKKLASKWIINTLNIATQRRLPLIKKKAKYYFSLLTGNHYKDILYYKSKIVVIDNKSNRFNLKELSKGTIEQLYLAMIFALSVIIGEVYKIPLIIDDGFTNFDVDRRKNALNLLHEISNKNQVIYFTSDNSIYNKAQIHL